MYRTGSTPDTRRRSCASCCSLAAPVYRAAAGPDARSRRWLASRPSCGGLSCSVGLRPMVAVVLWIAHTYAPRARPTRPRTSASTQPGERQRQDQAASNACGCWHAGGRRSSSSRPPRRSIGCSRPIPTRRSCSTSWMRCSATGSDKYEEVRAIINAGHRRGAKVPRTVSTGNKHEVKMFPVFGPRALAGIGKLPDTVADRSIPVRMLKKKRSEKVEKFREVGSRPRGRAIVTDARGRNCAASPPAREAVVPDELPGSRRRCLGAAPRDSRCSRRIGGRLVLGPRPSSSTPIAPMTSSLGLRMLADTRVVFDRLGGGSARHRGADRRSQGRRGVALGGRSQAVDAPIGLACAICGRSASGRIQLKVCWRHPPEGSCESRSRTPGTATYRNRRTSLPDPLPRYQERAEGNGVKGFSGGNGLDNDEGYGTA